MAERILSVRILFITPYIPSLIRVRPFNLIKSLSTMHEISLVSLLVEDYEQAMVKEVEQYCASVDLVNEYMGLPKKVDCKAVYSTDFFTKVDMPNNPS